MAVYLAAVGPPGLRRIAEQCYHKAHSLAERIAALPGWRIGSGAVRPFFNEFVAAGPLLPAEVNARLLERGIMGGLDVSDRVPNGTLFCATEMNSRAEIDGLVEALRSL
jgi:glycine dehydrogenase subunit 1